MGACAAAGKLPPPGWTTPDESGASVSVSDLSRRNQGEYLYLLKTKLT